MRDVLPEILLHIRRHKAAYGAGFLALLVTNCAGLVCTRVETSALGHLARATLGDGGMRSLLWRSIAVFLAATAVQALARWAWRMLFISTSNRIARSMRMDLYAHLGRLPLAFFHRTPTGDIMSRGTNDLESSRQMLGHGVLMAVDTLFYLLAVPPLLVWFSPVLSLCVFGTLPFIFLVTRYCQKRIDQRWRALQDQLAVISSKVQESASGVRVVKAYNQEESEIRAFRGLTDAYYEKEMSLTRIHAVFGPLIVSMARADIAITLAVGGWLIHAGRLSIEDFLSFLFFQGHLIWPLMGTGHVIAVFQQGAVSLKRLREILDAPEESRAPAAGLPAAEAVPKGEIELRSLSFTYPGADRPALSGVSLRIRAGSTVALVGSVGAGKTTLVSLIPRLFEPPRGTLLVDGVDVLDLPMEGLRRAVGFVPQNAFLFSDTVRENIAFSDPAGIAAEKVEWSAQVSRLAGEIERLPKRYEQLLGERGVNLSGGQRQRATIARSLLARSRILILDDCLSSVDLETEHAILEELRPLMRRATTLWVTHRVLSTRGLDRIVVLDAGRVAEEGTFDALLRKGGIFAQLVRRQRLERSLDLDAEAARP